MNAPAKTFGSPSGEPSTTRSMLQQMCEKLWTVPGTVLITKGNTIGRLRAVESPSVSRTSTTVRSAEAHHTAFYRKRKFGGGVDSGFICGFTRQSHALTILSAVELPDIRKGS